MKDSEEILYAFTSFDASLKRETLRWFVKEYKVPTPNIKSILYQSIRDKDWEVRITAMIISCRYNLTEFYNELYNLDLPKSTSSGLTKFLLKAVSSIKKAILGYLKVLKIPNDPGENLGEFHAFQAYVIRIIHEKEVSTVNDVFLLLKSLLKPISPKPLGQALPSCLTNNRGRLLLKGTNIEVEFIPPYSHWVGSSSETENPIRLVKAKKGFYMSKEPIRENYKDDIGTNFLEVSYAEAQSFVEYLSGKLNHKISIPNNLAIEMAIRGHNGRLYPWGNSLTEFEDFISPWGIYYPLGKLEYWSSTSHSNNRQYTFGSKNHQFCSQRISKTNSEIAAFRIAIR